MDGTGGWEDHTADCVHAKFGRDANVGGDFFHAADADVPVVSVGWSAKALAPIGAGEARAPPVGMGLLPQQPFFARLVSQQIFALETLGNCEAFSAFANEHDVSGMQANGVRDQRNVLDVANAADGTCSASGAMHATGI